MLGTVKVLVPLFCTVAHVELVIIGEYCEPYCPTLSPSLSGLLLYILMLSFPKVMQICPKDIIFCSLQSFFYRLILLLRVRTSHCIFPHLLFIDGHSVEVFETLLYSPYSWRLPQKLFRIVSISEFLVLSHLSLLVPCLFLLFFFCWLNRKWLELKLSFIASVT